MLKDNQLIITNPEGEESVCEIILTHEHNGKNYVIFEFLDSHEVSAAVYTPDAEGDEGFLSDIETDEEWDMLDEILDQYFSQLENEEDTEDTQEA